MLSAMTNESVSKRPVTEKKFKSCRQTPFGGFSCLWVRNSLRSNSISSRLVAPLGFWMAQQGRSFVCDFAYSLLFLMNSWIKTWI